MKNKQLAIISGIGLALYLIATGLSFAAFTYIGKTSSPGKAGSVKNGDQQHFAVDPQAPKTESCPINGKMYTKDEKGIWESRRPLAVMLENHVDSRPQSGVSKADVMYEAVE